MLTKRLSAAAELIGSCRVLYDIGCDHGYLPLELLASGQIASACFCDISAPSLEKARVHAEAAGFLEKSRFVHADGLSTVSPEDQDAVSICGMGGNNVLDILRAAPNLGCPAVVQANTEREAMRKGLRDLGWRVCEEEMVFENGRYYFLARYERGQEILSDMQAFFGPKILEKRPALFMDYLQRQKRLLEKALIGAKHDPTDSARILRELAMIQEALA